jgi:hypothetical protein
MSTERGSEMANVTWIVFHPSLLPRAGSVRLTPEQRELVRDALRGTAATAAATGTAEPPGRSQQEVRRQAMARHPSGRNVVSLDEARARRAG